MKEIKMNPAEYDKNRAKLQSFKVKTMEEIQNTVYPPRNWIVEGLLVEGLAVLSASRKVGKTWLCYQLSQAVSSGTNFLGEFPCPEGSVLYINMEQTQRNAHERSKKQMAKCNEKFYMAEGWAHDDEALDLLKAFLMDHDDCKLVVIDVLASVLNLNNEYNKDYKILQRWRQFALEIGICILFVTHNRKMDAVDVLDKVSGTGAVTGNADVIWILEYARGESKAVLEVIANDIEGSRHAIEFDSRTCSWSKVDVNPDELLLSVEKKLIVDALKAQGAMTVAQLYDALERYEESGQARLRKTLGRMIDKQEIRKLGHGVYCHNDHIVTATKVLPGTKSVEEFEAATEVIA